MLNVVLAQILAYHRSLGIKLFLAGIFIMTTIRTHACAVQLEIGDIWGFCPWVQNLFGAVMKYLVDLTRKSTRMNVIWEKENFPDGRPSQIGLFYKRGRVGPLGKSYLPKIRQIVKAEMNRIPKLPPSLVVTYPGVPRWRWNTLMPG